MANSNFLKKILSSFQNVGNFFSELPYIVYEQNPVELEVLEDLSLMVRYATSTFEFKKSLARVFLNKRLLAKFQEIQWVEISEHSNDEGPNTWRVRLYCSFFKRYVVLDIIDEVDAAITAAKIAKVLDKEVKYI